MTLPNNRCGLRAHARVDPYRQHCPGVRNTRVRYALTATRHGLRYVQRGIPGAYVPATKLRCGDLIREGFIGNVGRGGALGGITGRNCRVTIVMVDGRVFHRDPGKIVAVYSVGFERAHKRTTRKERVYVDLFTRTPTYDELPPAV